MLFSHLFVIKLIYYLFFLEKTIITLCSCNDNFQLYLFITVHTPQMRALYVQLSV